MSSQLTAEKLREILEYSPETGVFVWKVCRGSVKSGKIAGHPDKRGYLLVGIDRVTHKLHRLAWLHYYGVWPNYSIDHINGVTNDNRLINLRDVSLSLNQQNQKNAHKGNASGFLGVSKDGNKFKAQIVIKKKKIHIGMFSTPEEAHKAYIETKRKFHLGNTL